MVWLGLSIESHMCLLLGAAHQQRDGIAGRAHANHLHPRHCLAFQRPGAQRTRLLSAQMICHHRALSHVLFVCIRIAGECPVESC
jgi:hypothetical protein